MTPDDVVEAARLAWDEIGRTMGGSTADARTADEVARSEGRVAHLRSTDPHSCWVAETDGDVAGMSLALVRDGFWFLSLLAVRNDLQSQGIGRRLLEASLATAQGCRGAAITSSNDPKALRRYALAGFDLLPTLVATGTPACSAPRERSASGGSRTPSNGRCAPPWRAGWRSSRAAPSAPSGDCGPLTPYLMNGAYG